MSNEFGSSNATFDRRRLLVGGATACAAACCATIGPFSMPASSATFVSQGYDTSLSESPDKKIMFPVYPNSAVSWSDTYGDPRGGGRSHQGQDLLGAKMSKLLAVVDGTIVEFRHRSEGNSLWLRGNDGWFYSYLHINNDSPGTDDGSNLAGYAWAPKLRQYVGNETAARGVKVKQGELIAYLGDSGNAEGSGSHLHFEIRKPATGTFSSETLRLWSSPAVNPKVSLEKAVPAKLLSLVPPETFVPFDNSSNFIGRQFNDFLRRPPLAFDLSNWQDKLDYGGTKPATLMSALVASSECDKKVLSVIRLYRSYFLRDPDIGGLKYWVDLLSTKQLSLDGVSSNFSRSNEFVARYGTLTNRAFVTLVYRNVLDREPDAEGLKYWLDILDSQKGSRQTLMRLFSESPENKALWRDKNLVDGSYTMVLNRIPSNEERDYWVATNDSKNTTDHMLDAMRRTSEYQEIVNAH